MATQFTNYLANFKTQIGESITHTIIGDKNLNIYGGAYNIPDNCWNEFMKMYWNHVFYSGNIAYMTEKQLDNGAIYIDLDFKYDTSITTRQHTENHIIDIIMKYFEKINLILNIPNDDEINVFVMEKDNVNELSEKTKDGIHILIGIKMETRHRILLRELVINELKELLNDLPLINTIDDIIDKTISRGSTNCQMFGSRKPACDVYKLTYQYIIKNDEIKSIEDNINKITFEKLLQLSVRYDSHKSYNVKSQYIDYVCQKQLQKNLYITPPNSRSATPIYVINEDKHDEYIELLFNIIGNGYNDKGCKNVSRNDRLCICNVLKSNNYDKKIFIDYCNLREGKGKDTAEETWDSIQIKTITPKYVLQGLAKKINCSQYDKWFIKYKKYIKLNILKKGENEVAKYITDYLKNKLVYCNKNWWVFDNILKIWRDGTPNAIIINEIQRQIDIARKCLLTRISEYDDDEEQKKIFRKMDKEYDSFYSVIGKSGFVKQMENCLKEYLLDIFFEEKLDVTPYKIAYKNGILDLKTLQFNDEIKADDYITSFIPYHYKEGSEEHIEFVENELLKICNYNKEHLDYYLSFLGYSMTGDSSICQAFFNLLGQKASNGKSIIFETLMEIIPNYIKKTENDIFECKYGSRHKEIATWRGKRIIWVNELSKGKQDVDVIKDISDGTSVSYKVMYGIQGKMPITFKLAVVSNNTLKFDSDNGFARRLKTLQMNSDFVDNVEDDFENKIFKKDTMFGLKLRTTYKYALMSLIYKYSKAFVDDGFKMKPYPNEWEQETKMILDNNNKFQDFFDKWFKIDENEKIGITKIDNFLNEQNKHVNFKDELVRMKIKFTYNSQERYKGSGSKKGVYYGFRLKTEEEIDEDNKDEDVDV
jgi:hypothetical protein